jgi:transposase
LRKVGHNWSTGSKAIKTSVSKFADHQPVHRQEKMFERQGVEIARKTLGTWLQRCAEFGAERATSLVPERFENE